MQKTVLLTFDTEEFDLVNGKSMFEISSRGLENVLDLLDKHKIKATFFVTGIFAKSDRYLIKRISNRYEVASHGYSHKHDYKNMNKKIVYSHLYKTNNILRKITNKNILGYRSPRFSRTNLEILKKLGFKYDSSVNPIILPGRYNYLFHTRKIKFDNGIVVVPVSASPILRLPLFWFAFKNLGLNYAKFVTRLCLLDQDFVHLVFHPWEFVDIKKYDVSFIYKLNNGNVLIKKLDSYINWCKSNNMRFDTVENYLRNNKYIK